MSSAPRFASVFQRAGAASERVVRKFMPDPFTLVLLLSLVALALGFAIMPPAGNGSLSARGAELVHIWTDGFGNAQILKFGFQIILIVVTGEAIAESASARAMLRFVAALPKTSTQALMIVTAYALASGFVHWGFGLISSALLARAVGRSFKARGVPIHYPLLGTGAYAAMLLWHAGLTASAPLLMNTDNNFVSDVLGEKGHKIPLSDTIFAPYNLIVCAILFALVPFVVALMEPPKELAQPPADDVDAITASTSKDDARVFESPAEQLDNRRVLSFVIGAVGLTFLYKHLRENGFDLNHNVVNCAFLMLGLVLHESPVSYARAIGKSVRGISGIVLQFPFYGGILEVMTKCGISDRLAHGFIVLATPRSLPIFTFTASMFTKCFVPSGAGEWAVEGPPMLRAAKALGVPYGKTTMAVAYGNMLGNMFQPFWSLPLLSVMNLRAKDIMGYCLVLFVVCLPILAIALYFG